MLVSRSWQRRHDWVHHEAVWSSKCTSRESINVKTVNCSSKHVREVREFVLWRGAQSAVTGSSFLCHEFIAFGSVFIYGFFFSFTTIQEPSRTPQGLWLDMPLLLRDRVSDTLNQIFSLLSLVTDMWCPLEGTGLELFTVQLRQPSDGWGAQAHPCSFWQSYTSFGESPAR